MKFSITNNCEKDLKKLKKRGKDLNKLWDIVDELLQNKPLSKKHRPHKLSGKWEAFWECHIEPDWLLIYLQTNEELTLIRSGTHSDLFK